jgi:glycosyltransferase involved in cell wall biosynthesis
MLDIFSEVLKRKDKAVLLLVGEGGNLEYEIKNKVREKNLLNNVIFLGYRSDVGYVEQAMDVFLFPSKYEGMPISLVEAQFEGLPCVTSDSVSKESDISENIWYCSLQSSAKEWADVVLEAAEKCPHHTNALKEVAYKYNIERITKQLEEIYKKNILDK